MSLLKIPFSLSILWAVYTINTAPRPPPRPTERVGPIGPEVYILPPVIKTFFGVAGISEVLAIICNHWPENLLAQGILGPLIQVKGIEMTWSFLIAWICCLSGAWIRRRCYQILGDSFTFEISLRRNQTLVTSGPYAFVRHPSYSSGALGMFGALACHTTSGAWLREYFRVLHPEWEGFIISMGWLIAAVIFVVAIAPRLEKEDRIMKGRFGPEWNQWASDVPYKLVPMVY